MNLNLSIWQSSMRGGGASLSLTAAAQDENTSIGTTIGTVSVVGGTGVYTFTKTSDPDAAFTLTGSTLKNAILFDYETATTHRVTLRGDNGSGSIVSGTFTITVRNVNESIEISIGSPSDIAADGATAPVYSFPTSPHAVYDSVRQKTFLTYEGWSGHTRVPRITSWDSSGNTWGNTYRAGACQLTNDAHGNGSLAQDASGYLHTIFGPHLTNNVFGLFHHYSSLNPGDPSVMVPQPPFGGFFNEYTSQVYYGSQLWLFRRTLGNSADYQIGYQIGTPDGTGFIDWGAGTLIPIIRAGASSRLYWDFPKTISGKFHFVATRTNDPPSLALHLFYYIFDPATGNVSNFDGSRTDLAAALPISVADSDTYYQLIPQAHPSGTGSQARVLLVDDAGNRHLLYGDGDTIGAAVTVLHTAYIGGSWTSPATLGTIGSWDDPMMLSGASDGGVRAYWIDPDGGDAGSVYTSHRTTGFAGSWSTKAKVEAAPTYGLKSFFYVKDPHANFRVGWYQLTTSDTDTTTGAGTLKGRAFGDAGYVQRSSITLSPNASVIFSPHYKTSRITLSNNNLTATCNSAAANNIAIANVGCLTSNRSYFEFKINVDARPGSESTGVGFAAYEYENLHYLGYGDTGMALYNNGNVYKNNAIAVTMTSFTTNDVVRVAIRHDTQTAYFAVNSGNWNGSASADPVADVGGIALVSSLYKEFLPAAEIEDLNSSVTLRGDSSAWTFSAPTGFSAVNYVEASTDVVSPILTSPAGTATGSTTADLSVSTNEGNGKVYWVIDGVTPPTASQVRNGKNSAGAAGAAAGNQTVSGTGAQAISGGATGLGAATTYYAHFMHVDSAGNFSLVGTSSSFTTTSGAMALDPLHTVSNISLSNGNLTGTCTSTNLNGQSSRGARSQSTGKFYCEFTMGHVTTNNMGVGVCNATQSITANHYIGESVNSEGYFSFGGVIRNGVTVVNIGGYVTGDVILMAVDIGARLIWFKKNAGSWNNTGGGPATGTGGLDISLVTGDLFPAVEVEDNTDAVTVNFGATAYAFTAPAGFGNWT